MPVLRAALPSFTGEAQEELLADAGAPTLFGGCTVFRSAERLAGFAVADAHLELEAATHAVYQRIFAVTRGRHIYRIWNYVPHINAVEAELENYRRFCRGRSEAFEEYFGTGFQRQLPAASGVGATAGPLAAAFLAGDAEPQHFENPLQVPAFEYPPHYGPRPPSFSRATLVADRRQQQLFISGTAAIRGHATVAPDDPHGQLPCTIENLRLVAEAAGAGNDIGANDWQRSFKVFVRHADDFAAVRGYLEVHLLRRGDHVTWLHADLCRADLRLEIEAVLTR